MNHLYNRKLAHKVEFPGITMKFYAKLILATFNDRRTGAFSRSFGHNH